MTVKEIKTETSTDSRGRPIGKTWDATATEKTVQLYPDENIETGLAQRVNNLESKLDSLLKIFMDKK